MVTKATIPTIDTSDRGEDFVDFAVMMQRNNSSIAARTILQVNIGFLFGPINGTAILCHFEAEHNFVSFLC